MMSVVRDPNTTWLKMSCPSWSVPKK